MKSRERMKRIIQDCNRYLPTIKILLYNKKKSQLETDIEKEWSLGIRHLYIGHRYTFYDTSMNSILRGNFVASYYNKYENITMIFDVLSNEKNKNSQYSVPLNNLALIINLNIILRNRSILPFDVLCIIDSYL